MWRSPNTLTFPIDGDVTLQVTNTREPAPPPDDTPSSDHVSPPSPGGTTGTGEGVLGILLSAALLLLSVAGGAYVFYRDRRNTKEPQESDPSPVSE